MIGLAWEPLGFARAAAAALREIAEQEPEVAAELRRVADELEADVAEPAQR